jgi:hypothetical protein
MKFKKLLETGIDENESAYYIRQSSQFDGGRIKYDTTKISNAVKQAGGRRIRLGNTYGWSNQPKVVIFNTTYDKLDDINKKVSDAIGANNVIIEHKDW